nr:putative reverse transcriptase domain-containing protein [Tanacetum cinerariifolium]
VGAGVSGESSGSGMRVVEKWGEVGKKARWGSARISSDIVPFGACVRILMTLLALRIVIAYFDSCTAQDTFCVEEYKAMKPSKQFQLAYDVHMCRMIPQIVMILEGEMYTSGNIVTNSRVTLSWMEIVSLTFSEVGVLHVNWTSLGHCVSRRDTDVHDNFPNNYNEEHAERLANPVIFFDHRLAICYIYAACRHLELRYVIKDAEGQVITMDDFLFLPDRSGTIGSKTQDIVSEDQRLPLYVTPPVAKGAFIPYNSSTQKAIEKFNAKIDAAREKKDRLNAGMVLAKYAREESSVAPYKRQASPKPVEEGVTFAPKATTRIVVGEAHMTGPSNEGVTFSEANSIHSTHQEEGGSFAKHQFILEWGLRDDMRVSSVRDFWEVCVSQGEQLKKHERLNDEHVALHNQSDVQLEELSHLRNDLQREMQTNNGLNKQLSLLDSAHSSCQDREHELMDQLKEAEKDRDDWRVTTSEEENRKLVSDLATVEVVHHKLVQDFIPDVKIVESYRLHMDTLLQISPDLPSPVEASTGPSMKVNTKAAVTQAPLRIKRSLCDLSIDGVKNLATASGEVSAKMEDPELFTLPCRSGDSKTFDTLADLGSCVNIIPLYLFNKINKGILEETGHIFGLANGTKSYLVGIVKDVEVHIGKLKLLNNFYVIDMKKDPETPLLVGRGFLAITNALIDCRKAKIAVGERITRSKKPPKNGDGAWHAKIRLIDPDGEDFTKTLQSIPTTRKLSETESLREIIDLDHFYGTSRTDGQSERTIHTLEDMLRSCALEWTGNWDDYICLVEFAYNNSWHASIKCAPFEMLYGRKCRALIC